MPIVSNHSFLCSTNSVLESFANEGDENIDASHEVSHPFGDIGYEVRYSQVYLSWHLPPLGFPNPPAVYSFAA